MYKSLKFNCDRPKREIYNIFDFLNQSRHFLKKKAKESFLSLLLSILIYNKCANVKIYDGEAQVLFKKPLGQIAG